MIGVVLVAANPILRSGLREMLRGAGTHGPDDIVVIGEMSGLDELPRLVAEADVIVIALASAARLDAGRFLPAGEIRPALLALSDEPADLGALIRLPVRAWGILPSDSDAPEIISAIRSLHEGLIVGSPRLLKPLTSLQSALEIYQPEPLPEPLTDREVEVLQRIAQGLANKQIAVALGISEHTVKFHLSSIYAKLGATNRTEAVRLGTLQGLIIL